MHWSPWQFEFWQTGIYSTCIIFNSDTPLYHFTKWDESLGFRSLWVRICSHGRVSPVEINPVSTVPCGALPSGRTQEVFSVPSATHGPAWYQWAASPENQRPIRRLHNGYHKGPSPHFWGPRGFHVISEELLTIFRGSSVIKLGHVEILRVSETVSRFFFSNYLFSFLWCTFTYTGIC